MGTVAHSQGRAIKTRLSGTSHGTGFHFESEDNRLGRASRRLARGLLQILQPLGTPMSIENGVDPASPVSGCAPLWRDRSGLHKESTASTMALNGTRDLLRSGQGPITPLTARTLCASMRLGRLFFFSSLLNGHSRTFTLQVGTPSSLFDSLSSTVNTPHTTPVSQE
ncbi:hypothetical protein QR685DRAFT_519929 [Neurospora intermedia]|uniref:Uncharacterized protein n=1 Tax=Neurospora intermedia TaxID=5142 RepID=A0ABR3DHH8_NEUIN